MRLFSNLMLVAAMGGCTSSTIGGENEQHAPPAEEHPFVPERAGSATQRGSQDVSIPVASIDVERAIVQASDEPQGEDGNGALVSTENASSISIPKAGLTGTTSSDPVLRIGTLEFRHYTVNGETLRFIAADAMALQGHDTALLVHGDTSYELLIERETE